MAPAPARLPRDLYPVAEAARVAGCHPRTIYRAIRRGDVRAYGRPRCWRVSLAEVLRPQPVPGQGRGTAG
jgi:excisionase family DNA binding protein